MNHKHLENRHVLLHTAAKLVETLVYQQLDDNSQTWNGHTLQALAHLLHHKQKEMNTIDHFAGDMKAYRRIYATLLTIVIELLKSAELIIKDQFSRFFPAAVTLLIAFNPREQLIVTRIKSTPSVCTFSSYQSPHKTVKCLTSYLFMLTIN